MAFGNVDVDLKVFSIEGADLRVRLRWICPRCGYINFNDVELIQDTYQYDCQNVTVCGRNQSFLSLDLRAHVVCNGLSDRPLEV